jgi:hypothetical protein
MLGQVVERNINSTTKRPVSRAAAPSLDGSAEHQAEAPAVSTVTTRRLRGAACGTAFLVFDQRHTQLRRAFYTLSRYQMSCRPLMEEQTSLILSESSCICLVNSLQWRRR